MESLAITRGAEIGEPRSPASAQTPPPGRTGWQPVLRAQSRERLGRAFLPKDWNVLLTCECVGENLRDACKSGL